MSNETKLLGPTTTVWWLDLPALTTPSEPKASDILAALAASPPTGINLSPALAVGYTLNPTDSDTFTATTIVDESTANSRAAANYEGMFPFYMEANPDVNDESAYLAAYDWFVGEDRHGYALRRLGKRYTEPPAPGDLVDVFKFLSGTPRFLEPDGGGAVQFQVPLFKQGFLLTNKALA